MKKKSCLVICPIGEEGDQFRKHSDTVFKFILMPVLGEKFNVQRADMMMEAGKITNQIFEELIQADLVIADLTFINPNVFYELAIRHITCKACIHMISPPGSKIPFDISNMRAIFFDTDLEGAEKGKEKLKHQIESIETGELKPDNPIVESVTYSAIKKGLEDIKNVRFSGDSSQTISESMLLLMKGLSEVKVEISKLNESRSGYFSGANQGLILKSGELSGLNSLSSFGVTPDNKVSDHWTSVKFDGPVCIEGSLDGATKITFDRQTGSLFTQAPTQNGSSGSDGIRLDGKKKKEKS